MDVRRQYPQSVFGVREDHTDVDFGPEPSAEEKRRLIREEVERLAEELQK